MADEYQGLTSRLHFREQKVKERAARLFVERRCRFVCNDQVRPTDQSAGNRHPLLLADAQIDDGTAGQIVYRKVHGSQQTPCLVRGVRYTGKALGRKPARQKHVVDNRKIRHQIKLLKNEADAIGAKFVPAVGRKQIEPFAQDRHFASFGQGDPAQQIEQGRFSTAAGAGDEKLFANRDRKLGDIENNRAIPAPPVNDVVKFYRQCHGRSFLRDLKPLESQARILCCQFPPELIFGRDCSNVDLPRARKDSEEFRINMGQLLRMVADIPIMRMKFRVGFFIGFVVLVAVLILAVIVTMPVMLFLFLRLRRLDFSRLQVASCGSGRNEKRRAVLQAVSRVDYRLSVCIGGGRMLETDDI